MPRSMEFRGPEFRPLRHRKDAEMFCPPRAERLNYQRRIMEAMSLIADGKDFTANFNIVGYLGIGAVVFLFLVFYGLLPMMLLYGSLDAAGIVLWCLLPVVGGAVIAWVLARDGLLLKVPARVFFEGIELQPRGSIGKPEFVPFGSITRVEFFMDVGLASRARNRGIRIVTASGREISSVEHYSGTRGLRGLVEKIRPRLLKAGFVEKAAEGRWHVSFSFTRR